MPPSSASNKHAASASSTGGASTSPKRLTQEELQKSTQRLATSTRTEVTLKPIVESVRLSKAEEEKSVKRLYDEAIAAQKRRQAELTKRHDEEIAPKPASGVKVLGQAEEQEAVSRLYDKSIEHKKIVTADLEKKFVSPPRGRGPLDSTAQGDLNQRLYAGSISKHRESRAKLFEKYVVECEPKSAKRTGEELKANAARLHAGEK